MHHFGTAILSLLAVGGIAAVVLAAMKFAGQLKP